MRRHLSGCAYKAKKSGRTSGEVLPLIVCKGLLALREEAQQGTGSNGRADDASHVGTHSVHEQEVVAVVLQTQVVRDF